MIIEIINENGSFAGRLPQHLKELSDYSYNKNVGQQIVFEIDLIRVWQILLLPEQRLAFHTTEYLN